MSKSTNVTGFALACVAREGGIATDVVKGKSIPVNYGVRQDLYDKRVDQLPSEFPASVTSLTIEQAAWYCDEFYAKPLNLNDLPLDLRPIMYDLSFMSWDDGIQELQKSMGVKPDGIIGPVTLQRISSLPADAIATLPWIVSSRWLHVRKRNKSFEGWRNRLLTILENSDAIAIVDHSQSNRLILS